MGASRRHTQPTDGDATVHRLMLPRYFSVDADPHLSPHQPRSPFGYSSRYNWLNKEIERLNVMDMAGQTDRYGSEKTQHSFGPPTSAFMGSKMGDTTKHKGREHDKTKALTSASTKRSLAVGGEYGRRTRKTFALTPFDEGYYDSDENHSQHGIRYNEYVPYDRIMRRRKSTKDVTMDKRPTRQNPNRKSKLLISEHLDKMKSGLLSDTESQTDTARQVFVAETITPDPTSSLYGVALIAAVGIALTITLIGFALSWYMMSKKAKAAADVDYPAYGVTGPTLDCPGDRKLAHSAHMYHYQHQKQQILAMERNGVDQRVGSVSDPESEEENEEGDYTVYECPGFATTGDMEVKNPLFSDDPTPATPGKDAAKQDDENNKHSKDAQE